MRNNRGAVSEDETSRLVTSIGDPSLVTGVKKLGTEGTRTVILLDLSEVEDIEIYEEIYNNKEDYEVLDEVKHHGRYTVFISLNYIRKTPWPPTGRLISSLDSSKKLKKFQGGKKKKSPKKKKVAGFGPRKSSR